MDLSSRNVSDITPAVAKFPQKLSKNLAECSLNMIGNGNNVRVLEDPWIPKPWDREFVKDIFNDEDVGLILRLLSSNWEIEDKIMWHYILIFFLLKKKPYEPDTNERKPGKNQTKKKNHKITNHINVGYVSLRRSTTITLTLSVLCLARANLVSNIDASAHALSATAVSAAGTLLSGDTEDEQDAETAPLPRRHIRTTPQAVSFDTTSQSPSLAKIRQSSSAVRSVIVTSGSLLTYGFR
ncbi:hypothetical protein G4B88_023132 [Cannabis sativa]|uniref:Uncharacterized protein n=1 Tax=Cannabis sativa TaxID=3483 RepID=A0A7J6G723_CANSA|nr:hypothetical protein G4B88_023132 [Cannabis sativa]